MAKGTGAFRFLLILLPLVVFLSACASPNQPVALSPEALAEADALLVSAAGNGEKRRVQLLLSAGADVNTSDQYGYTPVMRAAENGHLSVVKVLVAAGANVNVSQGGESLLMKVVEAGDLLTAEMLLAAGADVHYRPADGPTALDLARPGHNPALAMPPVQGDGRRRARRRARWVSRGEGRRCIRDSGRGTGWARATFRSSPSPAAAKAP